MVDDTHRAQAMAAETPATPHNPGLSPAPRDPSGAAEQGTSKPADPKPADPDTLPSDVEADPSQQPT